MIELFDKHTIAGSSVFDPSFCYIINYREYPISKNIFNHPDYFIFCRWKNENSTTKKYKILEKNKDYFFYDSPFGGHLLFRGASTKLTSREILKLLTERAYTPDNPGWLRSTDFRNVLSLYERPPLTYLRWPDEVISYIPELFVKQIPGNRFEVCV